MNVLKDTPVTYFSAILLRNVASGLYLKAISTKYSKEESSKQFIITATENEAEASWWVVRPGWNRDFTKTAEDLLKINDLVSLELVKTNDSKEAKDLYGCLHSHARTSPSEQGHEVTLYNSVEDGDENDEWTVQFLTNNEPKVGHQLGILHRRTQRYLHCVKGSSFEQDGIQYQEVCATSQVPTINENVFTPTVWEVADLKPTPLTYKMHNFLVLPNVGLRFSTPTAFSEWLENQRRDMNWVTTDGGDLSSLYQVHWEKIDNSYRQYVSNKDRVDAYYSSTRQLVDLVESIYSKNSIFASNHPKAVRAKEIHDSLDKEIGRKMLRYWHRFGLNSDPNSFTACMLAFDFEHPRSFDEKRYSEIDSLKQKLEKLIQETANVESSAANSFQSQKTTIDNQLRVQKADFENLFKSIEQERDAILKTFRSFMQTKASVEYWGDKVTAHEKQAKTLWKAVWGFGIASFSLIVFLAWEIALNTIQDKVDFGKVTLALLIGSFLVWGLRFLTKNYFNQLALQNDASERVVMMETYHALMHEQMLTKEEERNIILRVLFRSSQTSQDKDDVSLSSPTLDVANAYLGRQK